MKDKQEIIIRYMNKGDSIRKIAREMGINRKTVNRYIDRYSIAQQALLASGVSKSEEHIESLIATPKYDSSNRSRRKVTEEVIEKIKGYLDLNREKRSLGQRKQQLKKIDIFELLKKDGFNIGYTTTCNLINKIDEIGREAFIKQSYNLGEVCEFDWGEVKIFINNALETYQLAVFTSAAGNYRYTRLFKKQDTLSFQQSHAYFFDKIGGVYKEMVYDNMRVAVKKFVGRHEKEATEGLLKLSLYYGFDFRFCNVRKGNEKGHVERSVEYVRRKAFSMNDRFASIDEANHYLEEVCDNLNRKPQLEKEGQSALEILKRETAYLLPQKPFFECAELECLKVGNYSTVSYKTCHYSVPEEYVGKMVTAKVYPQKIVLSHNDTNICTHDRLFAFHKWAINIEHYTKTLKRKPGALHGSLAMKQLDESMQMIFKKHYLDDPKDFIELLEYMKETATDAGEIKSAISKLNVMDRCKITTDKIKLICQRKHMIKGTRQLETSNCEIENNCRSQLLSITSLFNNSENLNNKMENVI
ncbi:MAG: IS21 family transposase [Desulfobacterales bacterium]|nr:IS21 family transposase [Desulfobacterales bacterium]